ncbi:MAG: cell wall metabolism sensor histidine kinase WalK [Polyangiaceae bacterium]|nr:cell wall metabolism sensor histidine kinase WalK [Polyangiaceae bacterium]
MRPPALPHRGPSLAPAAFALGLVTSAAGLTAAWAAGGPAGLSPVAVAAAALASVAASALGARALSARADRQMEPLRRSARALLDRLAPAEGPASEGPPPEAVDDLARSLERLGGGLSAALARLADERDRLESILETMMEGVLVTDGAGRIVLANRALRELTPMGASPLGRRPLESIRNGDLAELLTRVLLEGQPEGAELELGGPEARRVRVRAAPLRRPATPGVVAVLYDVTDLRRLEKMRRDFVANVSHELRTPIAAIRASAETLEGGALGDELASAEFVGIIGRNATRLHELVEDLLELSRLDARRLELLKRPVPVAEALRSAATLHALAAERKGIVLRVDGDENDDAALAVEADARALERILSNLVDNAIKYSRPGDAVTLSAERRGEGGVRLSVADTGPGVEARHLPRLFERFYRADKGRARAEGGTGLGLAIVKNLAEALGGRVTVESEPGQGARFHVDLAAAVGAEGTPADLLSAENRSRRASPWESTTDAIR